MEIQTSMVKELREKTGAGVMDCKRALVEAHGDIEQAAEILKKEGLAKAEGKAHRVASQGLIAAYIHAGGRIGAMVEVNCETDFVARTDEFKTLAHDIAMQVAATGPKCVTPDELGDGGTSESDTECLLLQPFIKNPSMTVKELIQEKIAKTGENIVIRRFMRFELGV